MNGVPLSTTLLDAVVEAVRRGIPVSTAWKAANLSEKTYNEWRLANKTGRWHSGAVIGDEKIAQIRAFFVQVEEARAEAEQRLVANVFAAAFEKNEKTGLTEWRAAAWWLQHTASRERYYQHREPAVMVQNNFGAPPPELIQVSGLSDKDLVAESPEYAGLLLPSGQEEGSNADTG